MQVPTVEEVAAAVKVPTVEEVAAAMQVDAMILDVLKQKPKPVSNVSIDCNENNNSVTIQWVMDVGDYLMPIKSIMVQLLHSNNILHERHCDPYNEEHSVTFSTFPYDTTIFAGVFVMSHNQISDATYSTLQNIKQPYRAIVIRNATLCCSSNEDEAFDMIYVDIEGIGEITVTIKAGGREIGGAKCAGNNARQGLPIHVCGTANVLDVVARSDIDSEIRQIKVDKPFKRHVYRNRTLIHYEATLSDAPSVVFERVQIEYVDKYGNRFDSNRYRTPRDKRGNVSAVDDDSITLTHDEGTFYVMSQQAFSFL